MDKKTKKDLRGTWSQAIFTLFTPILIVMAVRWCLIEPFVIPSGSMIPNLQIHDHIFANKFAYGLHLPFSTKWLWQWRPPQRGDIVVFRYPKNPEIFFIKRVMGLPGDEISVAHGDVYINGKKIESTPTGAPHLDETEDSFGSENYHYYSEAGHIVRYINKEDSFFDKVTVPADSFFAMGDNRDQSSDSRVWGFVPMSNLVGRAKWIWLSCRNTLPSASFLCDPQTIRWDRVLIGIK